MYTLLLLQLTAHFWADFNFQSKEWCDAKEAKIVSKQHFYHALLVFVLAYVFSLSFGFWLAALTIAIVHLGLDILKSWLIQKNFLSKIFRKVQREKSKSILFFIDQFLHIAVIVLIVNLFWHAKCEFQVSPFVENHYQTILSVALPFVENHFQAALFILALILCTSPSNGFIKNVLTAWNISSPEDGDKSDSIEKAGQVIGTLERLLTFILIVFNQFAAVGLVFAAKSILRYRDTQTAKTEYLLIGSLLSFGIAIVLGIYFNIHQ